MSGANNNGYAESKRMILGVGDIYLDGLFVGNLKGKVELEIKREYARQRAGNNIADQKAEVISEMVGMKAEVCDLKIAQLRRAFGITQAADSSTAKTIMKRQVITVGASGSPVTLAETPVVDATHPFKVMSLDRKTTYVTSTDYTLSTNSFIYTSGGSLTVGASVIVEYGFSDSGANSLRLGGETLTPPTFRLDYVVRDDSGKAWQLTFFKAFTDTDFKMAFNERESGNFTTYNVAFAALVDTTKPEGANMFEIVQEDATA
jgi:hypothetical protein